MTGQLAVRHSCSCSQPWYPCCVPAIRSARVSMYSFTSCTPCQCDPQGNYAALHNGISNRIERFKYEMHESHRRLHATPIAHEAGAQQHTTSTGLLDSWQYTWPPRGEGHTVIFWQLCTNTLEQGGCATICIMEECYLLPRYILT